MCAPKTSNGMHGYTLQTSLQILPVWTWKDGMGLFGFQNFHFREENLYLMLILKLGHLQQPKNFSQVLSVFLLEKMFD